MYGNCKHQIQDSGYLWEGEGMLGVTCMFYFLNYFVSTGRPLRVLSKKRFQWKMLML